MYCTMDIIIQLFKITLFKIKEEQVHDQIGSNCQEKGRGEIEQNKL